jgi:hypothetical protein
MEISGSLEESTMDNEDLAEEHEEDADGDAKDAREDWDGGTGRDGDLDVEVVMFKAMNDLAMNTKLCLFKTQNEPRTSARIDGIDCIRRCDHRSGFDPVAGIRSIDQQIGEEY